MAGKTQPPVRAAIWDELERFGPKSTPMRQPGVLNPLGPPREDPLAFRPMSIKDHLDLARAPKKPGTQVTVWAYSAVFRGSPKDHMYVEYDDGREQYIYRGGPSWHGVHAQVTPARESPDYRKGERVLYRTDLPGVTAKDAIKPVQAEAGRVERSRAPYGVLTSNSNGVVADGTQAQFGFRVGDRDTPGWRSRIPDIPNLDRWGPVPRREF